MPMAPNMPICCHVIQEPNTNAITHGPFPFISLAFTRPNIKLVVEEGIIDMQFRRIDSNNRAYKELANRSTLRVE